MLNFLWPQDGGSLFFTTVNRTILSFLLAKVAAEYVLRIVPPGIHEWDLFLSPEELQEALESSAYYTEFFYFLSFCSCVYCHGNSGFCVNHSTNSSQGNSQ